MTSCSGWSDPGASGDNMYVPRSCYQPFIDFVWEAYDFDKGDWDDGFGWDQPCDVLRPLARTFNGLWCLEYSAPDWWNEGYDRPIINWAGRYARENIDELDGRCGTITGPFATTQWGLFIDNWTQLKLPFFFLSTVSMRAGTIIHEARHASWKGHDNDPDDSSWGYNGAWRYHVCWIAWFLNRCTNTSVAMKDAARQRANQILANNFTSDPGFRLDQNGFAVPP
jgi:hypothetical protein